MVGRTRNAVLIEAPLQLTWDLTNDLTAWTDLFTEYQECTVLEQRGDTYTFRLTTVPDENGTSWSWVSERTLDPSTHEVTARRVETGPFEFMNLHWKYEAVPEGTLMTWSQEFSMKPTAPVDDQQMADRINRNTPVQMAHIRAKVEAAHAPPAPARGHVHHRDDRPGHATGCCRAVSPTDQPADTRRGGQLRVLLGPRTVGSTSGFMGVLDLQPGEVLAEHYHPFSEEYLYVAQGRIEADLDGVMTQVPAQDAVFVPRHVRHRLRNTGQGPARVVFQLSPLAPRPEMGHVDTEGES